LVLTLAGCSGSAAAVGSAAVVIDEAGDTDATSDASVPPSATAAPTGSDAGSSVDATDAQDWFFPDGSCGGPSVFIPNVTLCGGQIDQPTGVLGQYNIGGNSFVAYYADLDGGAAADCGGPTSNIEMWTATNPIGFVKSSDDCACAATYNCDCILAHAFTLSAGTPYALTIEAGTASPESCVMYQGVPYVDLSLIVNASTPAEQTAP